MRRSKDGCAVAEDRDVWRRRRFGNRCGVLHANTSTSARRKSSCEYSHRRDYLEGCFRCGGDEWQEIFRFTSECWVKLCRTVAFCNSQPSSFSEDWQSSRLIMNQSESMERTCCPFKNKVKLLFSNSRRAMQPASGQVHRFRG